MDKRLNTATANDAMERLGINQSAVADSLDVSREAVSQWFNHKVFPRPNKLLQLGKLLSLSYDQLVLKNNNITPQVAYRKVKGTKTKDHHIEKAQTMGMMLRHLVEYLPFDTLLVPPVLKEPRCDYGYLQQVTRKVREEIRVNDQDIIDFSHLIRHFRDLQTVLIPVMWGAQKNHGNAMHIYLPDSQTTWVYLNLDVNIHDFKFWMAHELGHCLSPALSGEEAENFADAFAAALLYPESQAQEGYGYVSQARTDKGRLNRIVEIAEKLIISPYTVYLQLNAFAEQQGEPHFALEPEIFARITNFNKSYPNLSDVLFQSEQHPSAERYIELAQHIFETPFFETLSRYLREHHKGVGMVQTLMDIPLLDARSIHAELT